MFWFSLQLMFETFLLLRKTARDTIQNVCWSSCKVPVILGTFWWNLNSLGIFSKKKYSKIKFHENPTSGSRIVSCGQTDMTNRIVAFRIYSTAPKNCYTYILDYFYVMSLLSYTVLRLHLTHARTSRAFLPLRPNASLRLWLDGCLVWAT